MFAVSVPVSSPAPTATERNRGRVHRTNIALWMCNVLLFAQLLTVGYNAMNSKSKSHYTFRVQKTLSLGCRWPDDQTHLGVLLDDGAEDSGKWEKTCEMNFMIDTKWRATAEANNAGTTKRIHKSEKKIESCKKSINSINNLYSGVFLFTLFRLSVAVAVVWNNRRRKKQQLKSIW